MGRAGKRRKKSAAEAEAAAIAAAKAKEQPTSPQDAERQVEARMAEQHALAEAQEAALKAGHYEEAEFYWHQSLKVAEFFCERFYSLRQVRVAHRNAVSTSDNIWPQPRQFFDRPMCRLPIHVEWRSCARQCLSARKQTAPRIHIHGRKRITRE